MRRQTHAVAIGDNGKDIKKSEIRYQIITSSHRAKSVHRCGLSRVNRLRGQQKQLSSFVLEVVPQKKKFPKEGLKRQIETSSREGCRLDRAPKEQLPLKL